MRFASLCLCMSLPLGGAFAAEEGDRSDRLATLVRELGADDFGVRDAATAELVELGEQAIPALVEAAAGGRPEVRHRAERILLLVVHRDLLQRFAALGAMSDREMDVEEGMWLIARIIDPLANRALLDRRLGKLAERVRSRLANQLGGDVASADVPPEAAIAALRHVLFEADRFNGNVRDYDDPRNSSLSHVLESREGLPILLSHVVIAVARRAEIPIRGLAVPGRYMCYYDASQRPEGAAASRIVDPFGAGRVYSLAEARAAGIRIEQLEPDSARTALTRMLSNLSTDLDECGRGLVADRVRRYSSLLQSREDEGPP